MLLCATCNAPIWDETNNLMVNIHRNTLKWIWFNIRRHRSEFMYNESAHMSRIWPYNRQYLQFWSNPLMIFATVHSLMNNTNLIDHCQAHLPAQYASNIALIRQKWYSCCDCQGATQGLHVQNKPLVCSNWLSAFKLAVPLFRFTLRLNC